MTAERPMLELQAVTKRYGAFTAVDGVSLKVPAGCVFGLLGPNGAGKTTTMKMVCGLVRPTSGRVLVDGVDVVESPLEAKRALGYVPDRPSLYEKLTAFEYVRFVGGLYALPAADVDARGLTLLAQFGLGDKVNALVESFSHGMKQRLVMASVLLHQPRLLVVDEPMVGLDPRGMRLLKHVLQSQARALGHTVIFSTHTLVDAEEICDEVAIMHQGRVVAQGTPAALRSASGDSGADLEQVFLALTEAAGPAYDLGGEA